MNVLITGATGLLGSALVKLMEGEFNIYCTGRSSIINDFNKKFLSFDLKKKSYEELLAWSKPEIIIHCAAITDVDFCEKNPEEAFLVNYESLKKLFNSNYTKKIVFISSDAVFDGTKINPSEKCKTSPLNVYGRTKKMSEDFLLSMNNNNSIIRTTIVGRNINKQNDNNLVEWIVDSVKSNRSIQLFDDVIFNPISTFHLANEIVYMVKNSKGGLFHISGADTITKFEFGVKLCKSLGFSAENLNRGSIKDLNLLAKRSNNQTLDTTYYSKLTGRNLPTVKQTINEIVKYYRGVI